MLAVQARVDAQAATTNNFRAGNMASSGGLLGSIAKRYLMFCVWHQCPVRLLKSHKNRIHPIAAAGLANHHRFRRLGLNVSRRTNHQPRRRHLVRLHQTPHWYGSGVRRLIGNGQKPSDSASWQCVLAHQRQQPRRTAQNHRQRTCRGIFAGKVPTRIR